MVDDHLEPFKKRGRQLLTDGLGRRAENENNFSHRGGAHVFERLRQHVARAQGEQLLCLPHARGCAGSQNDGAYSRDASLWA